jgi:hypothetical protein
MGGRIRSPKHGKTPGLYDVGTNNRYGKYPKIGGVMLRKYKDSSEYGISLIKFEEIKLNSTQKRSQFCDGD